MKVIILFIILTIANVIIQTIKSICTIKCGNRERGSVWTVYICYFLYIGGRLVYLVESNHHRTC